MKEKTNTPRNKTRCRSPGSFASAWPELLTACEVVTSGGVAYYRQDRHHNRGICKKHNLILFTRKRNCQCVRVYVWSMDYSHPWVNSVWTDYIYSNLLYQPR